MSGDGGHGMSFKPEVLVGTPGKELRWLGGLGLHGIVDGEHYFVLSTNEDGTTRSTTENASLACWSHLLRAALRRVIWI